jgi:hypothetical protein
MLSICQRSILCSKSVVAILPSLSEYTEIQFKFYKHRIRTPFIWKCVSECLNAKEFISEHSKCLQAIFVKAIYLKTMDVSIKTYWNLTFWGNLRLRFASLHGSYWSCDRYWHEVVTSVSSDVLNKLSQTALCNWHIFFPPIPTNQIKSFTLKLEAVHSCETLELTTLIMQCKNQKYNHHN